MATVKTYKELVVYQKGYEVAKMIYGMTSRFSRDEVYGLSSQLRRAAVAVPSNIAEGFMRGPKEYTQFLKIALGSAVELETQLNLALDLGYCSHQDYLLAYNLNQEVLALLGASIAKLSRRRS
jgi:four helix bundle protein